MKALSWIGLAVLVLGLTSLVVSIPRTERDSVKAAGITLGVETRRQEKIPLMVSVIMIFSGAGIMIAQRVRN
jgi:uncharacterized membrane protein